MEILGFLASVIMGLSLGLIGGGGSILTVPIMVYLFGVSPVTSTSYSLFVVGLTSLIGAYPHYQKGNVDLRSALIFGIPAILSVYLVRKFLVPVIPDPFLAVGDLIVTKSVFVLVLFSLLMVVASISMIRKSRIVGDEFKPVKYNFPLIFAEGIIVGGITGIVGAGGGFLIIPALVLFAGLPMKKAVGTSLVIIAMKSLIGFTGDLSTDLRLDFGFMLTFSAFAIAGILAGTVVSRYIPDDKLKPAFGWFVLLMGVSILGKEILLHD